MKNFTCLFLLLFLNVAAFAQDYIIKLNPVADTTIQNRNFYFDAVEDNRELNQGKRLVGHFGKNDKTAAVLENDLEAYFLDYLGKVYPKRDNDKPLTLRVNDIKCSSTGGMLSEAKVKLDIDILNSTTGDVIQNISLDKTRQPLMGGKTFGVLIEEIIAYGVDMVKVDK